MYQHKNKAFTLIELIVVIAIIAILVLLGVPKMNNYIYEANLTEMIANINEIEKASERYYFDFAKWPVN